MATASQVLSAGAKLAGENEAVVGSNKTTINKAYAGMMGQPYCGGFVRWCQEQAGSSLLKGCSNAFYVPTLRQYLESKGWRISSPLPGAIFIEGSDMHTGYVYENLGNGYFITLEGNGGHVKATAAQAKNGTGTTFEGIGYRKAAVGNFKFYMPAYDGNSSSASTPSVPVHTNKVGQVCAVSLNLCKTGNSGPMVKTIQRILNCYGYKGADGKAISVDGDFGANTAYAVKSLQAKLGVAVDGEVGKDTWTAMLTKLW